jgi:hypothetical protein
MTQGSKKVTVGSELGRPSPEDYENFLERLYGPQPLEGSSTSASRHDSPASGIQTSSKDRQVGDGLIGGVNSSPLLEVHHVAIGNDMVRSSPAQSFGALAPPTKEVEASLLSGRKLDEIGAKPLLDDESAHSESLTEAEFRLLISDLTEDKKEKIFRVLVDFIKAVSVDNVEPILSAVPTPDLVDVVNRISTLPSTDAQKGRNSPENPQLVTSESDGTKGFSKIPVVAPKLWEGRPKEGKMNPAQFIEEVYGDWIGKGLDRAVIRRLDRGLYQAFATWVRRHDIPTRLVSLMDENHSKRVDSMRVDAELAAALIEKPSDAYLRFPNNRAVADRLYQAALRRR